MGSPPSSSPPEHGKPEQPEQLHCRGNSVARESKGSFHDVNSYPGARIYYNYFKHRIYFRTIKAVPGVLPGIPHPGQFSRQTHTRKSPRMPSPPDSQPPHFIVTYSRRLGPGVLALLRVAGSPGLEPGRSVREPPRLPQDPWPRFAPSAHRLGGHQVPGL